MRNLNIKAPRLGRNRLGVFFVRHPSYIDERGKRKVVQQSLRTKDPGLARLLALQFNLDLALGGDTLNDFDPRHGISPWTVNPVTGEFKAEGAEDHARMMEFMDRHKDLVLAIALRAKAPPDPAVSPSTPPTASPLSTYTSLEYAFQLHLDLEKNSVSPATLHEKTVLFRDFIGVFGAGAEIRSISAEQITKRWTPEEANRPNQKEADKTLSLSRLEKRRGYLAKFFDWAKSAGLYPHDNPVKAKFATTGQLRRATRKWEDFNDEELQKIFAPPYAKEMDKPDFYWVPLMALFSGARLGELCKLTVDQFQIVEGVPVFHVPLSKTESSRRRVPIHSTLLNLGLWDCIQALKARGATHFLHHRPTDYLTKAVGRQWGVWLETCEVKTDRKVFHSFRSTAITEMHNALANGVSVQRAVGHKAPETQGVHGDYVRGIRLANVRDAVERLAYPMIDFQQLKLADPTFQAFFDEDAQLKGSESYKRQQQRRREIEERRKAKALADAPLR